MNLELMRTLMQDKGLCTDADLTADGSVHRFHVNGDKPGSKNGWYVVYLEPPHVVMFGSWKLGVRYQESLEGKGKSAAWHKTASTRSKISNQKLNLHQNAKNRAQRIWNEARDCYSHPYLDRKRVRPYGVREYQSALVIPLRDADESIWSLQFIDSEGGKKFLAGGKKAGLYFGIGGSADIICIVEGYATGASVHEATGYSVAIAFDAGNLKKVAQAIRATYPKALMIICADNDQFDIAGRVKGSDEVNAGLQAAECAAREVEGSVAVPEFSNLDGQPTDFNDLANREGLGRVNELIQSAKPKSSFISRTPSAYPDPISLFPDMVPEQAFPVDALGPILAPAVNAIEEMTQAPTGLIATSILVAAAQATQGHFNVTGPSNRGRPLSLFALIVADSGERKSTVDELVLAAHWDHERTLVKSYGHQLSDYKIKKTIYEEKRKSIFKPRRGQDRTSSEFAVHLRELGDEPEPPLSPRFLVQDATAEGLNEALNSGYPSMGLFSSEAGMILGGHSMRAEHRLYTIAVISELLDGKGGNRLRKGDGFTGSSSPRLSSCLMAQPKVAFEHLLYDPLAIQQGLLSRALFTVPTSTIGTRFLRTTTDIQDPRYERYLSQVTSCLARPLPIKDETRNELSFNTLCLTRESWALFEEYHNKTEREIGRDGCLRHTRNFTNKYPDFVLRIAAVLTAFHHPNATIVNADEMEASIRIMEYYTSEVVRFLRSDGFADDFLGVVKLARWLREEYVIGNHLISVADITQRGPNSIRKATTVKKCVQILRDKFWLIPMDGVFTIGGKRRHEVFRIHEQIEAIDL